MIINGKTPIYSLCVSVSNMQSTTDDSFELYDLRVEVVCPEGQRIMCGAKPGDHFILEGEMMRLPPAQGFSVYSLGLLFSIKLYRSRLTGS
jgi:hypothetical protein